MSDTTLLFEEEKVFSSVVEAFKQQLGDHLEKLILFGSRARGEATIDSDYDLLVVVDQPSTEIEAVIDEIAANFLYQHNIVLSVILISGKNFEEQIYEPLLMNVRREGIVL